MTDTVRLGIIGVGHLGQIHMRLAQQLPHCDLIAVADPCPDARQLAHDQFGVETVSDYRWLLNRIDAAIIAAPTNLHAATAQHLLERGIDVFVEKPMTATLAEAETLVRVARQHERILQVGHVERFNPAFQAAADQIERPNYIEATRTSNYTFRSTDVGVVLDLMIHDIDLVLSLVSSPLQRVDALGVSILGRHEDLAQARLTFENGCVANLTASRVSETVQRTFRTYGPLSYTNLDLAAGTAHFVQPDRRLTDDSWTIDTFVTRFPHTAPADLVKQVLPKVQIAVTPGNAIASEQQDFIRSVQRRTQPLCSGNDGLLAMSVATEILQAIQKSASTGQNVLRADAARRAG